MSYDRTVFLTSEKGKAEPEKDSWKWLTEQK